MPSSPHVRVVRKGPIPVGTLCLIKSAPLNAPVLGLSCVITERYTHACGQIRYKAETRLGDEVNGSEDCFLVLTPDAKLKAQESLDNIDFYPPSSWDGLTWKFVDDWMRKNRP